MRVDPLMTGYLTPGDMECMSLEVRKEILEKLERYKDEDVVSIVVGGKLVKDGIYLYHLGKKEEWPDRAANVGYIRHLMKTGHYIRPEEYWEGERKD